MAIVALRIPASSAADNSIISEPNPLCSAHRPYILKSISAQSEESVPPSPAWIWTNAPAWSYGSDIIDPEFELSELGSDSPDDLGHLLVRRPRLVLRGQFPQDFQVLADR